MASAGSNTIALTHFEGKYAALDNNCPHQGGPLGEGSIENNCLRCPWHGWEFNPLTGKSADDNNAEVPLYDVEVRDDGIYVPLASDHESCLMSGYLGSIGFGFPAAMGAWAAAPNRPIICVTGDGGFGQYMAEFTTAVKYKMNITHILLNNNELGKITKEQKDGQWEVWQTSLHNPNFSEYAKNCGGFGVRVTKNSELNDAMAKALAYDGPALVEVMADSELI